MQVQSIQRYSYNNRFQTPALPTFSRRGKPLTLQYIFEKRKEYLPQRVLDSVVQILSSNEKELPSLLEIHKKIYSPLLECKTLDEAKKLFPEFSAIAEYVSFQRESVYAREFKQRAGDNFALKVLQEYWANLKTKDEIAHEFGMNSRSSIDWALKQIGFVGYPPNYKTLLRASDETGNRIIASKTTAWNAAHPDLMYAKNKRAAQGCKTSEYRVAQSERIKKYDETHPERKEKISKSLVRAWEKCPDIRQAIAKALEENPFVKQVFCKRLKGMPLSDKEKIAIKKFFKQFWDSHPTFKETFSEARKSITK